MTSGFNNNIYKMRRSEYITELYAYIHRKSIVIMYAGASLENRSTDLAVFFLFFYKYSLLSGLSLYKLFISKLTH